MKIGIICEGKILTWLNDWIRDQDAEALHFVYIRCNGNTSHSSFLEKHFNYINVNCADDLTCDTYFDVTGKAWDDDKFNSVIDKILTADFILNNYGSLLYPLQFAENCTDISIVGRINGVVTVMGTGKFKTVLHNTGKQIASQYRQGLSLFLDYIFRQADKKATPYQHSSYHPDTAEISRRVSEAGRKHRWQLLFSRFKWNVGLTRMHPSQLLQKFPVPQVTWMNEENGKAFNADPFIDASGDDITVYFEHFNKSGKGIIAECNYNKNVFSPYKPLLERMHHLSYPFLVKDDHKSYIIPEASGAGTLTGFSMPGLQQLLMLEYDAVDPTFVKYNNKWWLFCTRKKNNSADLRLYIFHAASIEGPWQPHMMNPVKCDITSSRPAGNFFEHEGRLYRPAQDSSRTYGGRIAIQEVIELTEEKFEERTIKYIEPGDFGDRYTEGIHTLSFSGNYLAIDGKRRAGKLPF